MVVEWQDGGISVKRLTVNPKHDPTGRQYSWALCHERLSSIEDILGDEYDLDRLRDLVEADRDGRCVVMPDFVWKAGETQGAIKVPQKPH